MKYKRLIYIGLAFLSLMALTSVALASTGNAKPPTTLVQAVREATAGFKGVKAAEAAGYGLFHGCVSGPQAGAMGIHYANGGLVGDGKLDVSHPEALLYEAENGKLQLLGVEYIVMAEAWDAKNDMPPVLMGQMFNYVNSPNRYRLPAFYELHVWAWKYNPDGIFSDWNRHVSCTEFNGEAIHSTHAGVGGP